MVSKVVYLRGLFLQDPSAEGRHTAQEEAIELECKMQWLKKKNTQVRAERKWARDQALRNRQINSSGNSKETQESVSLYKAQAKKQMRLFLTNIRG